MSSYFDSRNAMIKAIANGEIEITRDGNVYTITGNTYAHKDFIKRELEASWDRDAKCWRAVDPRQGVISKFDELMPEPETTAEPETITINSDGSFDLPKSGATVMIINNRDGVQVDVYGTEQARAERAGSASIEVGDSCDHVELDAWLIRYGVSDPSERDGLIKLVGNIMTFKGVDW